MKILLARLFGIVMFIVLLAGWYHGSYDVVSFFAAVAWILIFLGGLLGHKHSLHGSKISVA